MRNRNGTSPKMNSEIGFYLCVCDCFSINHREVFPNERIEIPAVLLTLCSELGGEVSRAHWELLCVQLIASPELLFKPQARVHLPTLWRATTEECLMFYAFAYLKGKFIASFPRCFVDRACVQPFLFRILLMVCRLKREN